MSTLKISKHSDESTSEFVAERVAAKRKEAEAQRKREFEYEDEDGYIPRTHQLRCGNQG